MNRLRSLLLLLMTLLAASALLAGTAQAAEHAAITSMSWPKQQFEMDIPEAGSVVQETDSLVHFRGEDFEVYVVVEDRSEVSEESCIQYIFDDVRRHNGTFTSTPGYMLKERSVSSYYLGRYTNEDGTECLMAETCLIDRMSRRIYTVAFFSTTAYADVIESIIMSPAITNEPFQY